MNERLMQFRIGMFVIVAGLVLTMMIVWFGESPSLLRDQGYLRVRYAQAPGVLEGVPVRKSGIRIGEVVAIVFDERPQQPDGVLVTIAVERKYHVREGSSPRLTRSLIGDVAIDMQPGTGENFVKLGDSPDDAPIIEGDVAPDPSKALAAATKAFESAGDTLASINLAAKGLAKLTDSSDKLDALLATWNATGGDVSNAGRAIKRFIETNENDFHPAVVNFREVAGKINETLDADTQKSLQEGVQRFSKATARIESGIAALEPALQDLGGKVDHVPNTDVGQAVRRVNLAAADLGLLTSKLRDGRGGLNTNGSLQKLVVASDLHDNLNRMALSANQALANLRTVLSSLRVFAEKVAADPSVLTRGAFRR